MDFIFQHLLPYFSYLYNFSDYKTVNLSFPHLFEMLPLQTLAVFGPILFSYLLLHTISTIITLCYTLDFSSLSLFLVQNDLRHFHLFILSFLTFLLKMSLCFVRNLFSFENNYIIFLICGWIDIFTIEASHPGTWCISSFILVFFMSVKFHKPRYVQKILNLNWEPFQNISSQG